MALQDGHQVLRVGAQGVEAYDHVGQRSAALTTCSAPPPWLSSICERWAATALIRPRRGRAG